MRSSNFILIFAPILILILLEPAFEASTFSNGIKGMVIGLYVSLSIVGLIKAVESLKS